jgi:hypothetical protein
VSDGWLRGTLWELWRPMVADLSVGGLCGVREGGNRVPKRLLTGVAFNFRDSPTPCSVREPTHDAGWRPGCWSRFASPCTKRLSLSMLIDREPREQGVVQVIALAATAVFYHAAPRCCA